MIVVIVIHWLCAFVVMAEAINKMERTNPLAPGKTTSHRLSDGLKAFAWLALAMGAAGALISPLLHPLGIDSQHHSESITHITPSLAEVCVMVGFACLIVRTRINEGMTMTPPLPTLLERADELDIAAKIARELGDLAFAVECQLHADYLRQKETIKCGQTQNT